METVKTSELRTEAYPHNTSGHFVCGVCGETHDQDCAAARVVDPDGGALADDVCPACIVAGPSGAAERARAWAADLHARADVLDILAEQVGAITDWATLADLVHAELLAEAAYRDVPEADQGAWAEARAADRTADRERWIRAYQLGDEQVRAELEQERVQREIAEAQARVDRLELDLARRQAALDVARAKRNVLEARVLGVDIDRYERQYEAAQEYARALEPKREPPPPGFVEENDIPF